MTFTVIYEKGPTSWGAYVPDLPGVISVGDSRDEVEQLIQEAIEFHLEGMREEGMAVPAPSSFAGWLKSIPPLDTGKGTSVGPA
jgi:predicted RNase H-like HicB family nuclease